MVPAATSEETTLSPASAKLCRRFSLPEILLATQNFDDGAVIGHGGFGKVYKGHIKSEESGTKVVAIKRLDSMSNQGAPEFRAEVKMLSKLRHCHLVSLIGFCDDSKEMILVYEYMPKGTLDYHLHRADTPLSWVQRLSISIGAARGLDYLHTGVGTQHGIIHRDVKSSNILLDEDWAPKISDFGLSKIGPRNQPSSFVSASIKGTFGYLDPEFWLSGKLTRKTDVFAFGVVLFELLSGRPAVDTSLEEEQWSLARWAQKCFREKRLNQILDSKIKGQISPKCLKVFAQIAYRCLDTNVKERPMMAEVVVALHLSMELQEKFDRPAQPTGVMGFTRKMHKFIFVSTEVNSAHRDMKINKTLTANLEDGDQDEVPRGISKTLAANLEDGNQDEVPRGINKTLTANLEDGDQDEVPRGITEKMLTPEMKIFTTGIYSQDGENNGFRPRSPVSVGNASTTATPSSQGKADWIEQYEPGVYFILVALRDGTRDITRVRFSRRRFSEHQAETWWSENREKVYERYNVRGSDQSSVSTQSA